MLKINKLKIEIETDKKQFSFFTEFKSGVNLIYSEYNTVGKSSVISAIYYCLGLEEIIGGKGPNVLSSAFKSQIEYNNEEVTVLESKIYLEISNGTRNITIFRTAKSTSREPNLVTVYFSDLINIKNIQTLREDYFVHLHNSAKHKKGFYTFIEDFLNLQLPKVPVKNNQDRKLYMQLIFSAMFIEQKRGWGDIFSGMPYYDILDQKKRVIEYILGLDSLNNEKLKYKLKLDEKTLKEDWRLLFEEISKSLSSLNLELTSITKDIQILNEKDELNIIYKDSNLKSSIDDYLNNLKIELQSIINSEFTINKEKNSNALLKEIELTKAQITQLETKQREIIRLLETEITSQNNLKHSLEMIHTDILNNKDAYKLQELGSTENFKTFENSCPTCEQAIQDTILTTQMANNVMTIKENINHLEAQKNIIEYAIKQKEANIVAMNSDLDTYKKSLKKLYFLLQLLNNELYSPSKLYSEKDIYKKLELTKLIDTIEEVKINFGEKKSEFYELSSKWKTNQTNIAGLPKNNLTLKDIKKLKELKEFFVENLRLFGYRSSLGIENVQISTETYMPMIEKFDMKFDSSASDHIRRIWAFIIALAQTSIELNGNHPKILIFDEPGQHSIIVDDMKKFLAAINKIKDVQVIIGITTKDSDIKKVVNEEIENGVFGIELINRAFT